ncbi:MULTISPECIES: ANTAR domain-containing protein [Rhodococcus]|uniref:ANTAR domain-containing protein n=1 Tax=Rhodococcus TaxID=1827 RepID=UPI002278CB7C|nr:MULTISPECIES: ANTAR domain-containing protein [Rhodococcus]
MTLTPSERNFERALDSRAVIDQAKGVLMAVHGVDADGAFAMLVETSRRTNTKVRVVAEELLASVRIT